MKRRIVCCMLFIVIAAAAVAQQFYIDSLKREMQGCRDDTACMILFGKTADIYSEINPDSAIHYAEKMEALAKKLDLKLEEAFALNQLSYALLNKGNNPRSLQSILTALAICENPSTEDHVLAAGYEPVDEFSDRSVAPRLQRLTMLSRTRQNAGIIYQNAANYEKSISYYRSAIPLAELTNNSRLLSITLATLGRVFLAINNADSALIYLQKAYDHASVANYNRYIGSILLNTGRVYLIKRDIAKAKEYFNRAVAESDEHFYYRGVVAGSLALAEINKNTGNIDSVLYHVQNALSVAYYLNAPELLQRCYTALADYYKIKHNSDSAVKYQSLIIEINNSLFNSRRLQEFRNIDFEDLQRQQQVEAAKTAERVKFRMWALIAGLAIFLIVAIILYRNSLQRKKANVLLSQQKNELEKALTSLKTTQNQLIQSEKMASLGEMTAGIAHEIQNPLNFVNNFSEVNSELIDDLKKELEAGNKDEVLTIANDIKDNESKINHHGKRADAIVKSMLQHSRSSSGKKELTDLNALTDEYVRLAYHGLRAKDKSFNAKFETEFDDSVDQIHVVPQEIGRVLLNLINNAFYAVSEKEKASKPPKGGFEYNPTVTVSTKKVEDRIEITVKDNGHGIPQKVLDKIFQPFFTTKPPGQGTGLGLSLSYDIVTKAHGGEFRVETKEGEGSNFIISLPVK